MKKFRILITFYLIDFFVAMNLYLFALTFEIRKSSHLYMAHEGKIRPDPAFYPVPKYAFKGLLWICYVLDFSCLSIFNL